MRSSVRRLLLALATLGLLGLIGGCGSSSSSTSTPAAAAPSASTTTPYSTSASSSHSGSGSAWISTETLPGLGSVLVDAQGRTLYIFAPDRQSRVTCVSACATVWPPAPLASGQKPVAAGQVEQSLLASDPDPAGGRVVTYGGWPLYTYVTDTSSGQATGQALNLNGGLRHVISPSGNSRRTDMLLVSDQARDRAVGRLGRAYARGRLTGDELEQRTQPTLSGHSLRAGYATAGVEERKIANVT